LGWRALGAAHASDDGAPALQRRQITLGVPDLARDAGPEEVFALEALLEELNGVAFHKGCFVGQENVSRMKRRATTRKKFCLVRFQGPPPPFGTPMLADGAEIGSVRSGVPGGAIALLRLDRAGAAARLNAGALPLRLDPPPWLLLPSPEG
jgi:folate-binding protein YgfZ